MILSLNGQKDREALLLTFAESNGLNMDDILALYMVLGDDLFLLLNIFQGHTIRVPLKKRLYTIGKNDCIKLIECSPEHECAYNVGDVFEHEGVNYIVTKPPRRVLGHDYVVVERSDG